MLAGGRQLDNIPHAVGSFPLHGERVGPLNAFKKCMRSHCTSDREGPQVVGEIKQAVNDFEAADVLANVNGIFFQAPKSVSHFAHSPRSIPERLPKRPYAIDSVETLNAITKFFIDGLPVCNGTVPANDNFPPSEAEAA